MLKRAPHSSPTQPARRSALRVLLLGALGCVSGCGLTTSALQLVGLKDRPNLLKSIALEAAPDCNRNLPVALDIAFIEDATLATLLKGLGGPEWFARKEELTRRYGSAIQLLELEVVPLTLRSIAALPDGHEKATSILLFANYIATPGQYVADVAAYTQLKILLQSETYQLQDLAAGQS